MSQANYDDHVVVQYGTKQVAGICTVCGLRGYEVRMRSCSGKWATYLWENGIEFVNKPYGDYSLQVMETYGLSVGIPKFQNPGFRVTALF